MALLTFGNPGRSVGDASRFCQMGWQSPNALYTPLNLNDALTDCSLLDELPFDDVVNRTGKTAVDPQIAKIWVRPLFFWQFWHSYIDGQ